MRRIRRRDQIYELGVCSVRDRFVDDDDEEEDEVEDDEVEDDEA